MGGAGVEFLVGGAFAMRCYTGVERDTKDFDLMLRPRDVERALTVLRAAGFHAAIAFTHWLAKAHYGEHLIDLIFRAGNGLGEVDDEWFAHAVEAEVVDLPLRLCPPEEMIWQKAFIMERERFDGADVLHLLRSCGATMKWERLLARFGPDWRVLLSHLVLFGYVYPGEARAIPDEVLGGLLARLREERRPRPEADGLCRGSLLSRAQYLPDLERWGYVDARLDPRVRMSADEITVWTEAIDRAQRSS